MQQQNNCIQAVFRFWYLVGFSVLFLFLFFLFYPSGLWFVFDFSRNLTRTVAKSKSLFSAACVFEPVRAPKPAKEKAFGYYIAFLRGGERLREVKENSFRWKVDSKESSKVFKTLLWKSKVRLPSTCNHELVLSKGFPRCKNCELFLCLVAIVRVRAIVLTSLFSLFTSLVSFTGSYTETEPV